jgi:hypothetical protein
VKHLPLIHPGRSSTEERTMRGIRNDVTPHPSFGIAAHCHGWGKRGRSSASGCRWHGLDALGEKVVTVFSGAGLEC